MSAPATPVASPAMSLRDCLQRRPERCHRASLDALRESVAQECLGVLKLEHRRVCPEQHDVEREIGERQPLEVDDSPPEETTEVL